MVSPISSGNAQLSQSLQTSDPNADGGDGRGPFAASPVAVQLEKPSARAIDKYVAEEPASAAAIAQIGDGLGQLIAGIRLPNPVAIAGDFVSNAIAATPRLEVKFNPEALGDFVSVKIVPGNANEVPEWSGATSYS